MSTYRKVLTVGVLLASLAGTAGATGSASAQATCGGSPQAACALSVGSAGQTLTGTLAPGALRAWYVFYATQGTRISTTATDEENPSCSAAGFTVGCGDVTDSVHERPGVAVGGPAGQSQPSAGQTVSISWSGVLPRTRAYLLEVSGYPTQSEAGVLQTLPWQLTVSVSKPVQWPAPATCTVPKLYGLTEVAARRALVQARCAAGPVKRVDSTRLPAGDVLTATAPRGSSHAPGYAVGLTVSRGARRKTGR